MNIKIKIIPEKVKNGCLALLHNCAMVSSSDKILIITDEYTHDLGYYLEVIAKDYVSIVKHLSINAFKMHGQEPPIDIALEMLDAQVIFGLTKMSMAHSNARLNSNLKGIKYFSLPDYSEEVISSNALLTNFQNLKIISSKLAEILTSGKIVHLTTEIGTDLKLNIEKRNANPAPGCCYDNILLASPPDAETNIAPIEEDTNGVIVVDGSIPCSQIGLLNSPIKLTIENGSVVKIEGKKSDILESVFSAVNDSKARIVAEFGIGLNPKAKLCGAMLEDEGCLGTVHLGIGSNITIGGTNKVSFHLDHIIKNATIKIDEEIIMYNGKFIESINKLYE